MGHTVGNADNAESLQPRHSLTANKCEKEGCEHLHLMIYGGISGDTVIAETTLGKHDYVIVEQQ